MFSNLYQLITTTCPLVASATNARRLCSCFPLVPASYVFLDICSCTGQIRTAEFLFDVAPKHSAGILCAVSIRARIFSESALATKYRYCQKYYLLMNADGRKHVNSQNSNYKNTRTSWYTSCAVWFLVVLCVRPVLDSEEYRYVRTQILCS